MKELIISAEVENMDVVQDFILESIEDCPSKIQNQIAIAVDEIFSNIAQYAYTNTTGGVSVRIAVENAIEIEFEDCGVPYDPFSAETPDISLSAQERDIGGLGIFMVQNIMDSVQYRREDNKNILIIKKNIT